MVRRARYRTMPGIGTAGIAQARSPSLSATSYACAPARRRPASGSATALRRADAGRVTSALRSSSSVGAATRRSGVIHPSEQRPLGASAEGRKSAPAPPEAGPCVTRERLLADRTSGGLKIRGAERHQLLAIEPGELVAADALQPQRLRVQRLLEERADETCVAEALAASSAG